MAAPSAVLAQVQINQTFISQGPAPSIGPVETIQSNDNPPNGSVAGAVGPIVTDPLDANTIYVGTPNGGIWKSTNGGASWVPLTDKQASLSVSSLSLDPTDPKQQTLIAGTGLTANGSACRNFNSSCFVSSSGGILDGLLYSNNGGTTWTQLGATTFANQSVSGVAAVGQDILASTSLTSGLGGDTRAGALYRSTNGGSTFTQISGAAGSGLPAGPVTSLVVDPTNPNRIYAAVSSPTAAVGGNASSAVYVSNDTGATWTQVFNASNSNGTIQSGTQTYLKIATGPGGSLAVGVINVPSSTVTGLFWSGNSGSSWTTLQVPVLNPANQAIPNFAIAIDPKNKNLVYVSGDETAAGDPFTVSAFRIDATTTNFISITDAHTSNGSTPHADSRSIAFTANGTLLLSSDGTIYARSNPSSDNGAWTGISGNISAFEIYHITYDAVGKRLAVAAQDNGVAIQSAPNSQVYNAREGADGLNVIVNDVTLAAQGYSVFYSTTDSVAGPIRIVMDRAGNIISPNTTGTYNFGAHIQCDHVNCPSDVSGSNFYSPWVANNIDPTRMAIGGDHVYVTQDTTLTVAQVMSATTVNLTLTDLGQAGTQVTTISYGTRDNINMVVAGGQGADQLYQSTTATANSIVPVTAYAPAGGLAPTGIVLDPRSQYRYFVADNSNLFGTVDQGNSFVKLTANLPSGIVEPTTLAFISNNGVNALVVGGVNNVANAQSTIAVADSDAVGGLSNWRPFGTGLPNTLVSALYYSAAADVLAVGTFGRGAFALYDVTSYFPQATVLQFGLADNDSMPDASYLTNGTVGVRPLIKYGSGTLTIAGDATYTGGTVINGGVVILGTGGASGSVIGNVTFCSNAADPNCDATTGKLLAFNRSDVYTFGGSITGPGQVAQIGSGEIVLSGNSTYSGPTTVEAGTLSVTGSITSSVFVESGAVLSGSGTVGSTTIDAGGVLAPANPGGALTVQGNLVFATAGTYLVEIANNGADRVNVTGAATLGGNVFAALTGTIVSKQYTILNAAGGISGTFASLGTNLPATLPGTLGYDASNVFLNLSLNYNALGGLNANQQNVGNALANFFNSHGSIPVLYATLSSAALSQIAGETATGSQQTTFQAMSQFITTLLDPFIGGRESSPASSSTTGYAEEGSSASAYADSSKTLSERERAAYGAVFTKAPLRQVYDPHWSVWASSFGGSQTTDGNAATGSNSATSRIFGVAAGADYLLSPRTIAGFALAGGGTNFSVANAGTGRSDLFQAGAFVRHTVGNAYLSGALAYGWQDVATDRMAIADKLHAEFNANALSGRVEAGYRVATKWMGITPYAAGQFTTFWLPSYAESVVFGSNAFALAYGSQSVTDTRSELGFRTDRSFALATGLLTLRSRFAWAHDFDPNRNVAATFQALPGASFVVGGAAQSSESALTTVSAEMKWRNGWSTLASFEGEFSQVTASYAGKGVVRYAW